MPDISDTTSSTAILSGLETVFQTGRFGADGEAGILISLAAPSSIFVVSAWSDTASRVQALVCEQAGIEGPDTLTTVDGAGAPSARINCAGQLGRVMRVEPLKWWLLGVSGEKLLQDAFARDMMLGSMQQGTVVDQSHGFVGLLVQGEQVVTFLNRLFPLPLQDSLGVGGEAPHQTGWVATTFLHHVAVTLAFDGSGYTLYLPRSFAASLYEILFETALQFGLQVSDKTPG